MIPEGNGSVVEVNNPENESTLTLHVVVIAVIASLGGFIFGLDIGYIGPIETFQGFVDAVNDGEKLSSVQIGWITGIFSIGALIASFPLLSSRVNDTIGRRSSLFVGAAVFCLSVVIQATAFKFYQILIGRFIAGCAVGLFSCTVPMYVTELAPKEWRGLLTANYQWSITFGILVAYVIDALIDTESSNGWRWAVSVQLLPGLALAGGMIYAPPSPRWLVLRGDREAAEEALRRLCSSEERAQNELQSIVQEVQRSELQDKPTIISIFQSDFSARVTLLGMLINLLEQVSGINAFMYYGVVMFEMLGDASAITSNIIIGAVNFFATVPGLLTIDFVGRTRLLLFSSIGMMLACLVCGVLGTWYFEDVESGDTTSVSNWITVSVEVSICFFCGVFRFWMGTCCNRLLPRDVSTKLSCNGAGLCAEC